MLARGSCLYVVETDTVSVNIRIARHAFRSPILASSSSRVPRPFILSTTECSFVRVGNVNPRTPVSTSGSQHSANRTADNTVTGTSCKIGPRCVRISNVNTGTPFLASLTRTSSAADADLSLQTHIIHGSRNKRDSAATRRALERIYHTRDNTKEVHEDSRSNKVLYIHLESDLIAILRLYPVALKPCAL
jgi:hypothetical protein